jgi:hypothetical protein
MAKRRNSITSHPTRLLHGRFGRDLSARRVLQIELPEFLICALEARLTEVNVGAKPDELCSLHNLIESELVSLVSVRDVAELESAVPGFAMAVQQWLSELRE